MVSAEFMDIFGFVGFLILFVIGFFMVKKKDRLPSWVGIIVLLIGLLGLIVDGIIVTKTFIMG